MKEKVKDLDPVLRNMLYRFFGDTAVIEDDRASIHFSMVNWKLATNEERLKYAELMYKKGHFISGAGESKSRGIAKIISGVYDSADGPAVETDHKERGGKSNQYYPLFIDGEWAEVISRPDEKEETKEPEFQPGEMVYGTVGKGHEHHEPVYYSGGKTKEGGFICMGDHGEYDFRVFDSIRKIQPDPEKKYRVKAREIMQGKELIDVYLPDDVLAMLIEALKTEVK